MSVSIKQTLDVKKGTVDGVEKSIVQACRLVASQARALTPVDTGNLRSSIGYTTVLEKDGELTTTPKKMVGYVGTPVSYGIYQEFGTRRMAPQPFLRPAAGALAAGSENATVKKIMFNAMKTYEGGF